MEACPSCDKSSDPSLISMLACVKLGSNPTALELMSRLRSLSHGYAAMHHCFGPAAVDPLGLAMDRAHKYPTRSDKSSKSQPFNEAALFTTLHILLCGRAGNSPFQDYLCHEGPAALLNQISECCLDV